jgi:hypothetical protein
MFTFLTSVQIYRPYKSSQFWLIKNISKKKKIIAHSMLLHKDFVMLNVRIDNLHLKAFTTSMFPPVVFCFVK